MKDIILLHTGSVVDIEAIQAILDDNDITCMTRDEFSEGLIAGIPSGIPDSIDLYVLEKDFEKATELISDIIK